MDERQITRRNAVRLIVSGGFGLLASACATAQTGKEAVIREPGVVDRLLQQIQEEHKLTGLAAALVRKDTIVASGIVGVRRHGTADKLVLDDRFHIASCTKSVTATLAAIQVSKGRLKWTTTLADGLPTIARKFRPEYRSATLEQLLAHEARMPAYTQPDDRQVREMRRLQGTPVEQRLAFVDRVLSSEPPNVATGDAAYSNIGYAAAGAMIERAAGSSWEELVQSEIAQPLEMKFVGFGYPATTRTPSYPHGHSESNGRVVELPLDERRQLATCLWPAGAVHCSIGDFALYAADHLNGLVGRRALLPQAMYERLHRPLNGGTEGFTLGWGVQTDKRWGTIHFGAGSGGWFFARIKIVPEHDAAVVALSNSGMAGEATNRVCFALLDRFAVK